ncbi:MAG: hypothetical protein HQM08_18370 [Candidatus Riflebacteria bacterium]|nr:hypothetical protein [Candidatus Riflebacteria bacterium]
MKKKNGLTLTELALTAALIGILFATGGATLARSISYYYSMANSERAINELLDSGLLVTRTLEQGAPIASFPFSGGCLYYSSNGQNKLIQDNITGQIQIDSTNNNIIKVTLSSLISSETLNFVVNPLF